MTVYLFTNFEKHIVDGTELEIGTYGGPHGDTSDLYGMAIGMQNVKGEVLRGAFAYSGSITKNFHTEVGTFGYFSEDKTKSNHLVEGTHLSPSEGWNFGGNRKYYPQANGGKGSSGPEEGWGECPATGIRFEGKWDYCKVTKKVMVCLTLDPLFLRCIHRAKS